MKMFYIVYRMLPMEPCTRTDNNEPELLLAFITYLFTLEIIFIHIQSNTLKIKKIAFTRIRGFFKINLNQSFLSSSYIFLWETWYMLYLYYIFFWGFSFSVPRFRNAPLIDMATLGPLPHSHSNWLLWTINIKMDCFHEVKIWRKYANIVCENNNIKSKLIRKSNFS